MKAEGKLITFDEVGPIVAALRSEGKTVVTTNGSFDIVHVGHVRYLKEASRQGDVLIVGLNSDLSIRTYKDPSRPINPQQRRAELLLAIRFVDYVVIYDETEPIRFIEAVKPDVHVNGEEYGRDCVEAEPLKRIGARLHLIARWAGLSTTELMGDIIDKHSQE